MPQVRDWARDSSYRLQLLALLSIEDVFRDETGHPFLSRTTVDELTDTLREEYEAFRQRDPSTFKVE
jgi:transposase-like protein